MGDDTKTAILETARYLFSKNGYEATSVSRLAKETGVTKSLIYYYFEKKEDILSELLAEGTDDLFKMHQKMSDSGEKITEAFMIRIMENFIEKVQDRSEIIRIMLQEFLKGTHKENNTLPYFNSFLEYIKSRSKKYYPDDEKKQMKFMIDFMFFGGTPFYMFVVFKDFLSEKYHISKEELWEMFKEIYKENYIRPMNKNIKKH